MSFFDELEPNMPQQLLITGGAGYIGSHTTLAFLDEGYDVVVLDNLSNSSSRVFSRVEALSGRAPKFILGDVRDARLLQSIFAEHSIGAVVHLAGIKAVGESWRNPLAYYNNNVAGSVTLCEAMAEAEVYRLVFSSSATVYGASVKLPISEDVPSALPASPYGRTKAMIENMLSDLAASDSRWRVAVLRYFNPAGAHESGLLGESPSTYPNNLLPFIGRVAHGELEHLSVFGNDYPTHDGTGVRDYVHVADLAVAHLKALRALDSRSGVHAWNLGAGVGHSVLDIVRAFEQVSGRQIPYQFAERRSGDVAECWTDPSKALIELGWKAERSLQEIICSAWRWQQHNPLGYES